MSQPVARTFPVTVGNNARALAVPLTDPELVLPVRTTPEPKPRRARTPLSLVVSSPKRSSSSLVVILFMVVVAALSVVLVMSISVSKGQYELVGLKNQQSDLIKANQTLEQGIAAKQAPQELVAHAAALGMVPAASTGQIDVRTKTVSGSPQPASADTIGLVSIPPALVDKPVPVVPVVPEAEAPAAEPSPAAGILKAETTPKAAPKTEVSVPPALVVPDLNGGTIPAPEQRDN